MSQAVSIWVSLECQNSGKLHGMQDQRKLEENVETIFHSRFCRDASNPKRGKHFVETSRDCCEDCTQA